VSGNIDVVRRFGEAMTNRDWRAFRGLVAEDWEWTDVPSGEVIHGVEALVDLCRAFTAAFPDFRVESLNLIGRGTHAATGRAFERTGVGIVEVRDGKIVAYRDYFDRQTMSDQLGADWA
jgi:ketosteroid isomerase-like protein